MSPYPVRARSSPWQRPTGLPHVSALVLVAITAIFSYAQDASAETRATSRNATRATTPRVARLQVQQATPRAPDPAPESDVPPTSSSDGGIFGPVRIGPLAGASVPRPISLEMFLRYKRSIGIGLEYSVLPTVNVDGISLHASAFAGDLRWFILDSPVFLGAGFGVQSLRGDATFQGYAGDAEATKVFFTPRLGLLWTFQSGFTIGADAGIELVVSHRESFNPDIDQIRNNSIVATLTRDPLPDIHLLRLGWLF